VGREGKAFVLSCHSVTGSELSSGCSMTLGKVAFLLLGKSLRSPAGGLSDGFMGQLTPASLTLPFGKHAW
jgi:hypothetical protein